MDWLNYHHLYYFWLVVREGGVAAAARRLRLAHPTVSAQVKLLEDALGEPLLMRQGRNVVPTEVGRTVYRYADEIFALGGELVDTVRGRPTGRPERLVVGIAEAVPKLIAKRLLGPALALGRSVSLVCREDKPERLFAALASHEVDVVLTDGPLPSGSGVKAFNHLLGESGVVVLGTKALVKRHRKRFPGSLADAPMLLPTVGTDLRRGIDAWFDVLGVRPDVVAEFDDPALLKVIAQDGAGLFFAPEVLADEVCAQYGVTVLGRVPGLTERFYAISPERRVRNAGVAAICEGARTALG